jgi:signal transduction histidine kinase
MRVMPRFSSISARLKLLNLFVTGIALLLAFASFLAYDMIAFERDLLHTLQTEAQIMGPNSAAALFYDDSQALEQNLSALRGSPEVLSAVVLNKDGKPFAAYTREGESPLTGVGSIPEGQADGHSKRGHGLLYGSRIMYKGEQIGSIFLLAKSQGLVQRTWHYAMIAAIILMLCLLLALLMTSTFRRLLTEPLIGLAQTAQVVREEKDYSVRAKVSNREDELALLVRSFNEMLDDIQVRDKQLEQSRTALEERVQQRTAELSAANLELEAFSYTVAHDLRGPLDNIGNIGFLLKETYGNWMDPEGREFLNDLLSGTKKMSTLINDLLNLSRASRQSFHRQILNLSEMVASILEHLQAGDPERYVQVTIAPGIVVLADNGLLCVVLENLLGNAWKYTSKQPNPTIEFGNLQSGGETVFFVRDNGAGFDPHYSDRLFQPFQRLHVQSDFPGTGVGLATVNRIISRHEGRIWAEGAPGKGATFYFTLPYVPGKAALSGGD